MKIGSLLLLENAQSRYDVLKAFLDGVEMALNRAGIITLRASVEFDTTEVILQKIKEIKADATLGLNAIIDEPELQTIPHIYWGCDLGFNYAELLEANLLGAKNTALCLMDEDSCKLFKMHGVEAHFLPHAFAKELLDSCREAAFESVRPIEVVAPCSFFDEELLITFLHTQFPEAHVKLLLEVAEEAIADPSTPHYLLLFKALDINPKAKTFFEETIGMREVVRILDFIVRAKDRNALLENVSREYEVHMLSAPEDHEKIKKKFNNRIIVRNPVSFYELKEVLLQARFVLNSVPTIKRGFHERLFYGLACGCHVITNQSAYLPARFPESNYLLTYNSDSSGFSQLLKKMREVVHQGYAEKCFAEKSREQLLKAHQHIEKYHTWDTWVQMLLNEISNSS